MTEQFDRRRSIALMTIDDRHRKNPTVRPTH